MKRFASKGVESWLKNICWRTRWRLSPAAEIAGATGAKGSGVEFISAPVEFRPGVSVVCFRGPDGDVCELRQGDGEASNGF
jgi:hypothetical protein